MARVIVFLCITEYHEKLTDKKKKISVLLLIIRNFLFSRCCMICTFYDCSI